MATRIVLVRHAEPTRWTRGRAIGRTDVALSREGTRQARVVASSFGRSRVDRLVSSPAMRALRTAGPISWMCNVPVEVDDELREIDFGAWDGRTLTSIRREHPALFQTWMQAPTRVTFPEGESWPILYERARSALERIAESGEGRTTVAVTHLGVILATLGRILSVPDGDVFDLTVPHGSVIVIGPARKRWVIRPSIHGERIGPD